MRRRHSSIHPQRSEDELSLEEKKQSAQSRLDKVSPYPEQPGQEWGREKQTLMDEAYVKFSTAKAPVQGEDCLECVNTCRRSEPLSLKPALRPSEVVKMQQQLTVNATSTEPSSSSSVCPHPPDCSDEGGLRAMWDNVLSWMKKAVEYVALDGPAEAQATTAPTPSRKRRLVGKEVGGTREKFARTEPAQVGKSTTVGERRSKRRQSLGGQRSRARGKPSFGALRSTITSQYSHAAGSGSGLSELVDLEPITEHEFQSDTCITTGMRQPPSSSALPFDVYQHQRAKPSCVRSTPILQPHTAESQSSVEDGLHCLLSPTSVASTATVLGIHEGKGVKVKFRRSALREYYGRSVNSPNLDTGGVRRSPRLAEKKLGNLPPPPPQPPPPPPPPPPLAPPPPTPLPPALPSPYPIHVHAPAIPCAPPTPQLPAGSHSQMTSSPTPLDNTREALQRMQDRLRSRVRKRAGERGRWEGGEEISIKGGQTKGGKPDLRVCHWAEIQARSRKMSTQQFLDMAEQKKQQLRNTLEDLQKEVPKCVSAVVVVVEQINEGSQWFPGGNKDMREEMPLFKSLEWKVDILNEYVQICNSIQSVHLSSLSSPLRGPLHSRLDHIREEFDMRHRQWEAVITTSGSSWVKLGLCVDTSLLNHANQFMCGLVATFSKLVLTEATKITGLLLSTKCTRTIQLKERLKDCLTLLQTAMPYFLKPLSHDLSHMSFIPSSSHFSSTLPDDYEPTDSLPLLTSICTSVAFCYTNIAVQQFEGFMNQFERQDVFEHFEGILKTLGIVKCIILKLPTVKSKSKHVGVLSMLPESSELCLCLQSSCVDLIQHICSQTQTDQEPDRLRHGSRELVLWMMFGCKYVHHILELLGSGQTGKMGVEQLLADLQNMEGLLPN